MARCVWHFFRCSGVQFVPDHLSRMLLDVLHSSSGLENQNISRTWDRYKQQKELRTYEQLHSHCAAILSYFIYIQGVPLPSIPSSSFPPSSLPEHFIHEAL
jgi:hypothetical protein